MDDWAIQSTAVGHTHRVFSVLIESIAYIQSCTFLLRQDKFISVSILDLFNFACTVINCTCISTWIIRSSWSLILFFLKWSLLNVVVNNVFHSWIELDILIWIKYWSLKSFLLALFVFDTHCRTFWLFKVLRWIWLWFKSFFFLLFLCKTFKLVNHLLYINSILKLVEHFLFHHFELLLMS